MSVFQALDSAAKAGPEKTCERKHIFVSWKCIYRKNNFEGKSKSNSRICRRAEIFCSQSWTSKKTFFKNCILFLAWHHTHDSKFPPFIISFPTSADDDWKFEFWPLHFEYREYYSCQKIHRKHNIWTQPNLEHSQ